MAANTPPILIPIGSKSVDEGEALSFAISAIDSEGIPTLSIDDSDLPTTGSITDNGDGTGLIVWTAPAGSAAAGPYVLNVIATDDINPALTDSENVMVTVNVAGAPTGPFDPDGSNQFSIEAENFDNNVMKDGRQWLPHTTTAGYSGSMAMQSLPDDTFNPTNVQTRSPRMDYELNFAAAGTYTVCVLGFGPTSGGDTLHVGYDNDATTRTTGSLVIGSTYTWTDVGTIAIPSTGQHQVNIWMAESGSVVDKFVLKTTTGCSLSGSGPVESSRSSTTSLLDTF